MISPSKLLSIAILLFIFIKTCSYAVWTWKAKNRTGAAMVFIVALSAIILPVYKLIME